MKSCQQVLDQHICLLLVGSDDAMSALQLRGDARSARGRGRPRGTSRSRDARLDNGTFNSQQAPPFTTTSNSSSAQSKPLPKQNRSLNRQWRNSNPASRAPKNHVNSPPHTSPSASSRARDQSWRNPVNEPSSSYQKQMSELYQNVCTSSSSILTEGHP